jgi:taurine dioxygenase
MPIKVTPLDAPLGAEISGLDARNITAEDSKAIFDAFLKYHVLVLHDQHLTDADLVEFGKCFGTIEKSRVVSPLSGRDDIMVISNIREDGKPVGQLPDGEMSFHIDRMHQAKPCRAAALMALEIPQEGGDTMFADMVLAYDTLPESTKQKIAGRTALNTYNYGSTAPGQKAPAAGPQHEHPVARTIPETGKKALFVCRLMTDHITGLEPAESRKLIDELCDHAENPKFVYTHKWKVGDIIVWDNRCTQHARTDFSELERRLMKRVTIGDDRPPMQ